MTAGLHPVLSLGMLRAVPVIVLCAFSAHTATILCFTFLIKFQRRCIFVVLSGVTGNYIFTDLGCLQCRLVVRH